MNETEEWFYQVRGSMLLKVIEDTTFTGYRIKDSHRGVGSELEAFEITGGTFKDVVIGEGEMFLLPGSFEFYFQNIEGTNAKDSQYTT